jgi:hypothetical protein
MSAKTLNGEIVFQSRQAGATCHWRQAQLLGETRCPLLSTAVHHYSKSLRPRQFEPDFLPLDQDGYSLLPS